MWQSAGNEYAILSTKPPDITHLGENTIEVPHLCQATFTSE